MRGNSVSGKIKTAFVHYNLPSTSGKCAALYTLHSSEPQLCGSHDGCLVEGLLLSLAGYSDIRAMKSVITEPGIDTTVKSVTSGKGEAC